MNLKRILIGTVVTCTLAGFPAALAGEKWLHVRVEEQGSKPERVSVNIPLSVVTRMLPLIAADELQHGKLHLDIDELDGIDLRELAAALRDAPDADFVTVQSEEETVRVRKEQDFLIVHAEDRAGRADEKVRVRMPLAVVDALVGDDPHELDLVAALDVLGEYHGDPLVDVESDDTTVRVWIDHSDTGE